MTRTNKLAIALSASLLAAACTGALGGQGGGAEQNGGGDASGAPARGGKKAGDRGAKSGPATTNFAPAPAALRRLTGDEYRSSVTDLLGAGIGLSSPIEEVDGNTYGFTTVGAAQVTISENGAQQFLDSASALAGQVFADDAGRASFVACSPAGASDPCVEAFVRRFGRRAWRRALSDDEASRTLALVTAGAAGADVWAGLELGVTSLLASPNFLFRAEVGVPVAGSPGLVSFSGYEMASRLSYFIWGTTPDDELLDAAEQGALTTPEGVAAEADRLLASPRAHDGVGRFFDENFGLAGLASLTKVPAASPTLAPAMRAEIARVVEDLVFTRDADVREIFDTRATFVNAELAKLYAMPDGIAGGDDFAAATFPTGGGRGGIFGFAGILALYAHESNTSPTRRGKFLRERLLCQVIAPPPANVNTGAVAGPEAGAHQTMRQRLAAHASPGSSCYGCHSLMDPPGLVLEHFDALGAYRADDGGLPIDTRSVIDGTSVADPTALGAYLHDDPRTGACLTRQLYRYATAHQETAGEASVLDSLGTSFAGEGYRWTALVKALVASDGFRFAAPPP